MRTSIILTALLVATMGRNLHAAIVFSNDFETDATAFSTSVRGPLPTDAAGFASANQSQFLGIFSNDVGDSTTLTLTGLSPFSSYTVGFDLFIGKSWDGNSTFLGPNTWKVSVGGGSPTTLVDTTFQCLFPSDGIINNFTQSYSDLNPIGPGSNPAFTGADVARTSPGFRDYYDRYAIYYFGHGLGNPTLSFTPSGATATITFTGALDQGSGDEFWAIDNIVVEGVPEPQSVALAALALFGLAANCWRRKR